MKLINKIKSHQSWILIVVLSVLASSVVSIPIAVKFYSESFRVGSDYHLGKIILEVATVFIVQYLFCFALLSLKKVGLVIWSLIFFISFLIAYLFVLFGKNIDAWVISDMLENINGLTFEYLSPKAAISIAIFVGFFVFLARVAQQGKKTNFRSKSFVVTHLVILVVLLSVIFFEGFMMKKVRRNYPPLSVFSSVSKYIKIKKESDIKIKKSQSLEIIKNHQISYDKTQKPKLTVLIIGESLRNDYFYEMLPQFAPKLNKDKNIVFFKNVSACETSTRKSIPCLLTNVDHKNWEGFLDSVNVIDVFKKLDFRSYWIDNQSLYGYFDSTYSFLAKSSDVVIEEKYINLDIGRYDNYDEVLLPYIKKAIDENSSAQKDKFILIHLLGSHWHLDLRYPKEYAVFSPHCSIDKDASQCSKEQIKNSYKNSIAYSLKVMEDIIDLFRDKNSVVLFTPDHGISLGENGRLGNAAEDKPLEQVSVPLFVWHSDEFKKENRELTENLHKNSLKKITHEYVFNSLLGCSGIKTDLVKDEQNLCKK